MYADIAQIPVEGTTLSGLIPPERLELNEIDGFRFTEDISIELRLTLTGSEFTALGTVSFAAITECIRCLEDFSFNVEIDFVYTDSIYQDSATRPLSRIDLAPQIREEILLNLPSYPVCDENCKGLCPVCGQNLNLNECNCENK